MKNNILLLISTMVSSLCFAQNSTTNKSTMQTQGKANLIGQWIPVFDKNISGKKISIKTADIDTLVFKKDSKYIRYHKGAKIVGTWSINPANKTINLKKPSFDIFINGKMENETLNDSWERYEKISKDTLTIIVYLEEVQNPKYNIRYYLKK